jgi:Carboxypeptidase regulatory-like domain/TonB-dependent Receptor Plug Domain
MKRFLLLSVFAVFASTALYSQGITTSGINGVVKDEKGEPLPGATVIARHTPTGTEYGMATNPQGRFYFPNVRVGGPYSLTVTFVGYADYAEKEFVLALGENRGFSLTLKETQQQLEEVVVTVRPDDLINTGRTGASTHISTETIERNPSISRSISDFTRLTPQAASGIGNGGTSIAGRNSRYNNVTIDGAVNNDVFGLNSSGAPGSNAGSEIISLDAVKEVSVVVSPYDVTLGSFSGGGINAVTRSGSNEVEGSAYYFFRNENTTGKTLGEDRQKQSAYFNKQYGARLGLPIIKNKLFFFGSVELQRAETPFAVNLVRREQLDAYQASGSVPANVSLISVEDAQSVYDYLKNNYQYDAGTFGPFTPSSQNNKYFGRIDWNINDKHQLTFRHNHINALQDELVRNQQVLEFSNNGFLTDYVNNSTILEINSRFSANKSNRFIAGYTSVDDNRNVSKQNAETLFPHVDINLGSNRIIRAGGQRSSQGNLKSQDILQITNNFSWFLNKHTITVGTHNEHYKIFNSFVNRYNGHYEYASMNDFLNNQLGSAGRMRLAYSLDYFNDRFQAVTMRFFQTAFYLQDEFEASNGLRLTAGLRLDIPIFLDKPNANPQMLTEFGLDTQAVPSQVLWSPRIGFNYNHREEGTHQLRGGLGIFTGRVPFVWISNQYTNSGATLATLDVRGSASNVPLFRDGEHLLENYWANVLGVPVDDPAVTAKIESELKNIPTSEVNLMAPDFKLPQVLRANLGYDIKLPMGVVATVEGIVTKTINEINYENINLTYPTEKILGDGRPRHTVRLANPKFQNVLLVNNTNKGYQYSFTASLQKSWSRDLFASVAYNYGQSRDVNSGTHTTALSGWEGNPTPGYSNEQLLSYSVWDLRHRVVGNVSYRKPWLNNKMATTISVYYNGQSGEPFSYIINQDLNNDGSTFNDLAYIPGNKNEIVLVPSSASDTRTTDEIWEDLNSFIMRDDYLQSHRGEYAARNAARTPWESRFDMRLMHEFMIKTGKYDHSLQLTMDIENFANLLDQDFGRDYFVNANTFNLVRFEGFEGGSANTGRPVYSFDNLAQSAWQINNLTSVWRMQFGVRYTF